MFPLLRRVSTKLDIGPGAYLPVLRAPIISSAIMAAGVVAAMIGLPSTLPSAVRLVVEVLVGVVCYAGALWFLFRDRVLALVRAAAQLRGESSVPTSP
jgi:hypothetical protein